VWWVSGAEDLDFSVLLKRENTFLAVL
jgi:hypothetical protein